MTGIRSRGYITRLIAFLPLFGAGDSSMTGRFRLSYFYLRYG